MDETFVSMDETLVTWVLFYFRDPAWTNFEESLG